MNILIDLDGTLLDARRRLFSVFTAIAPTPGLTLDGYWRAKRRGRSNADLLRALHNADDDAVAQFTRQWMSLIEAPEYLALDTAFPGVSDAMTRLAAQGHALYIVTARQFRAAALAQIARESMLEPVRDVLVTEQRQSKVDLLSASAIDLDRDDILVGDTGKDIESAQTLGIRSAAVQCGFLASTTLARYLPDRMYESFDAFARSMLASVGDGADA